MRIAIAAGFLAMLALAGWGMAPADGKLTVHEWGTFTGVSGADGVPLTWRPLGGPPDLPKFVYRFPEEVLSKSHAMSTVRMETPVLYFYPDRAMEVGVKVGFPQGMVTEWYPNGNALKRGIDWGRVSLRPGAEEKFPREKAPSHYYPARETDAAPVRVGDQDEKFLFYRGVGWFALPLTVTLNGDQVLLKSAGKDRIPHAILFERRGALSGFRSLGFVQGEVSARRPELLASPRDVMDDLHQALIRSGLYEKEAAAMIETWRDTWFEEGLRVFYILPRPAVDVVLPLTINPAPDDVVRVFVGRAEVITPELEQTVLELVRSSADIKTTRKQLEKYGRFALPALYRAYLACSDPAIKERIANLMAM